MGMNYSYGYRKKMYHLGKDEVRCWMCSSYKSGVCSKFKISVSDQHSAEVCNSFAKRKKSSVKSSTTKVATTKKKNNSQIHKWYAIKQTKGVKNKIVTSWAECEKLVKGNYAVFKSFPTEAEAKKYLKEKKVKN